MTLQVTPSEPPTPPRLLVVAFGEIAEQAFLDWRRSASGRRFQGHFESLTHPTMPDAAARPGSAAYRAAMKRLLEQWNPG